MDKNFWERSRTNVSFPGAPFIIKPDDKIAFWGSCFADELSKRSEDLSLRSFKSPFGIIYNPLSMGNCLQSLLSEDLKGDLFFQNSLWRHFDFHSSRCFPSDSSENKTEAMNHFTGLLSHGAREIRGVDYLIITLGTAWTYRLKESERVVNNCHRCDNRLFDRDKFQKWDPLSGTGTLGRALDSLKKINPRLKVILTVSPVRHLRNDARENSLSKAILRCYCADLCESREWIHYFPSYEIVMDELRDYRWYGDDLCHPSSQAVEYIMYRFFDWAGGKQLQAYIAEQDKERKRRQHRPLTK